MNACQKKLQDPDKLLITCAPAHTVFKRALTWPSRHAGPPRRAIRCGICVHAQRRSSHARGEVWAVRAGAMAQQREGGRLAACGHCIPSPFQSREIGCGAPLRFSFPFLPVPVCALPAVRLRTVGGSSRGGCTTTAGGDRKASSKEKRTTLFFCGPRLEAAPLPICPDWKGLGMQWNLTVNGLHVLHASRSRKKYRNQSTCRDHWDSKKMGG